jgi:hypothetical protein
MQSQFDFKKARVVHSTTDRDPYAVFYVWDVQKNALVRKRKNTSVKYKTPESKLAFCKDFSKKVNILLAEGFHIDRTRKPINKTEAEQTIQFPSLDELTPRYINFCTNISRNSEKELNDKLNRIQKIRDWLSEIGMPIEYPSEITVEMAQACFISRSIRLSSLCSHSLSVNKSRYSSGVTSL